jgi:hypothetical protein
VSGDAKRFLSPETLALALTEIAALAAREGVRLALLGGFAMQLRGSDRLTADLDLIADRRIDALPYGTPLSFGGEAVKVPCGVTTDLIMRDDEYADLYQAALDHAERIEGVPVPVVTAEYLAVIKMAAGRGKDLQDLDFLIVHDKIDVTATRKIVAKTLGVYAAKEFANIVKVTLWKHSQGML